MRQNVVRVLGSVAIAALIAGGASACKQDEGTSGGSGSKACDLKIGFFGALSGADAGLVTPMKQGADLAVAQYNEKNADCKVSMQAFDSQGKADLAGGLATSAASDQKIVGVIGPAFSGESEVGVPIFEQAGLPMITPSATRPSLSTKGWKVFHRGVGNDLSQGPAIASYVKNVLKAQKVFVIDDQSAYGAGLADEVKKGLGASLIAGTDRVVDNAQEFGAQVSKVKTSGATVLAYLGYTEEAAPFLKQLRANGWTGTFIGGDGINDANMISVTGQKDVEGTVATCPCGPATEAKGNFVKDFKTKYNNDPGVYADVAYDLANIFLEAIKDGKTSRSDIEAFLGSYNKAGSASGVTYKWEGDGELDPAQVKVWAFKATNGAWAADQEIPKG